MVLLLLATAFWLFVPTWDNGRGNARDASAKTNARNAVSLVEACFTDTQDYRRCGADGLTRMNTGLAFGTEPNEVTVTPRSATQYVVYAYSTSGGTFIIAKLHANSYLRICDKGPACPATGKW